ncbi:MAG: hypothetical protein ABIY55_24395 [Kofleriaceae bacterium]
MVAAGARRAGAAVAVCAPVIVPAGCCLLGAVVAKIDPRLIPTLGRLALDCAETPDVGAGRLPAAAIAASSSPALVAVSECAAVAAGMCGRMM